MCARAGVVRFPDHVSFASNHAGAKPFEIRVLDGVGEQVRPSGCLPRTRLPVLPACRHAPWPFVCAGAPCARATTMRVVLPPSPPQSARGTPRLLLPALPFLHSRCGPAFCVCAQTLWPNHCVQGSLGCEFHPYLDTSLAGKTPCVVIRKGLNRLVDSYSAFGDAMEHTLEKTPLEGVLQDAGITEVWRGA